MAAYITVGATTTHGGKVITGSPHTTHNGIPISRKGDKVICKKCKKVTTILTGDASFIVDGAPIARAGDVTSCGAKLIAVQQSFCESDFEVMGVEQAAPLVFAKSDPEAVFASLAANNRESSDTEMSDEELGVWVDVSTQEALQEGGLWASAGTREEIIYQERVNALWIDVDGDRQKFNAGIRKIGEEAGLVLDIMSFPLGVGAISTKAGVKAGQYVIKSKVTAVNKVVDSGIRVGPYKGSTPSSINRYNRFLENTTQSTSGSGVRNFSKPSEVSRSKDWELLTKDAQSVREVGKDRKLAIFSDKSKAISRPSDTGPRTIEIQRPDGNKIVEIRYAKD